MEIQTSQNSGSKRPALVEGAVRCRACERADAEREEGDAREVGEEQQGLAVEEAREWVPGGAQESDVRELPEVAEHVANLDRGREQRTQQMHGLCSFGDDLYSYTSASDHRKAVSPRSPQSLSVAPWALRGARCVQGGRR